MKSNDFSSLSTGLFALPWKELDRKGNRVAWGSGYYRSRAKAEAVSRWLPTAAARVRARVW
jgi:hypothetical protein